MIENKSLRPFLFNIWGKAKGDVKQIKSVKSGAAIKVEKIRQH